MTFIIERLSYRAASAPGADRVRTGATTDAKLEKVDTA
jgi:hypothetical protein